MIYHINKGKTNFQLLTLALPIYQFNFQLSKK